MSTSQRSLKIGRELLFSVLLTVLQFVPGPLLLPALVHAFTKDEYAAYSVMLNASFVLNHVMALGTATYIFRSAAQESVVDSSKVLKSTLILVLFSSTVITMLLFLATPALLGAFDMAAYQGEFHWLLIVSMLTAWLFVINFYQYGQQKINLYNISLFVRNTGWRYAIIALVVFGLPIDLMLVVRIWLFNLIIAIAIATRDLKFADIWRDKASLEIMRQAIKYSVPLIPYYVSAWALIIIVQYQLQYFSTTEEVANFSFGVSLLNIIVGFATVVPQVLRPYIFQHWRQEELTDNQVTTEATRAFKSAAFYEYSIKYTAIIFVLASMTMIAFAPELTVAMGGEKYLNTFPLLSLFSVIFFLRTVVTSIEQRLLSTGQSVTLSLDYLLVGGLLVVLGSLLTFWDKTAYGATLALCLVYLVLLYLVLRQVTRGLRIKWEILQIKPWVIWIGGCSVLLVFAFSMQLSFVYRGLVMLVGYLILLVMRRIFVTDDEISVAMDLLNRMINRLRR